MLTITIEGTLDKVLKELDLKSPDELTMGPVTHKVNGKNMRINQLQSYGFYGKMYVAVEMVSTDVTEDELKMIRNISDFKEQEHRMVGRMESTKEIQQLLGWK